MCVHVLNVKRVYIDNGERVVGPKMSKSWLKCLHLTNVSM